MVNSVTVDVAFSYHDPSFTPKGCKRHYYTFRDVTASYTIPVYPVNMLHHVLHHTHSGVDFFTVDNLDGCYVPVAPVEALSADFTLLGENGVTSAECSEHARLVNALWGLTFYRAPYNRDVKHERRAAQREFIQYGSVLFTTPSGIVDTGGLIIKDEATALEYVSRQAQKIIIVGDTIYKRVCVPHVLFEVNESHPGYTEMDRWGDDDYYRSIMKQHVTVSAIFDFSHTKPVLDYVRTPQPAYALIPIPAVYNVVEQLSTEANIVAYDDGTVHMVNVADHMGALEVPIPSTLDMLSGEEIKSHVFFDTVESLRADFKKLGFIIYNETELSRVSEPFYGFAPRELRLMRERVRTILERLNKPNHRAYLPNSVMGKNRLLSELQVLDRYIRLVHQKTTVRGLVFSTIEDRWVFIKRDPMQNPHILAQ